MLTLFKFDVRTEILNNYNKSDDSGGVFGGIFGCVGSHSLYSRIPHITQTCLLGLKMFFRLKEDPIFAL